MYVVTNRQILKRRGLGQFGKRPNERGPHEIRLFEVTRTSGRWQVDLLNDRLHGNVVRSLAKRHGLDLDLTQPWFASLQVASVIAEQARRESKHVVIYVHGYNNDMADVLSTAQAIEDTYNVIVVPFSWPANGGGVITGALSYKADKRDARASVGALDRLFMKAMQYLLMITEGQRTALYDKARRKHRNNPELRSALYAKLLDQDCPFTVNLLAHSMGNYLYKQLLKSTASEATRLLFDNVVLAAADVNNQDHAWWLDRIRVRGRIFVPINENDFALRASRAKAGQEQLARLGHVTYGLNAEKAAYIDLTNAAGIGNAHGYFIGDPIKRNDQLRAFFSAVFSGQAGEQPLRYDAARNVYRF